MEREGRGDIGGEGGEGCWIYGERESDIYNQAPFMLCLISKHPSLQSAPFHQGVLVQSQ